MRQFTDEELQNMTIEDAKNELSNEIYAAASLVESLEYTRNSSGDKRIRGNGHHIRQKIAEFATNLLEERWRG